MDIHSFGISIYEEFIRYEIEAIVLRLITLDEIIEYHLVEFHAYIHSFQNNSRSLKIPIWRGPLIYTQARVRLVYIDVCLKIKSFDFLVFSRFDGLFILHWYFFYR